jgi:hypothetical protein
MVDVEMTISHWFRIRLYYLAAMRLYVWYRILGYLKGW